MKDGRGQHMIAIKKYNRDLIKNYMEKNTDAFKIDISRDLNLAIMTVRRHVASIESELLETED